MESTIGTRLIGIVWRKYLIPPTPKTHTKNKNCVWILGGIDIIIDLIVLLFWNYWTFSLFAQL